MEADLIGLAMEILGSINNVNESNFGPTTDSSFQVKMNEFQEGSGITLKSSVLLAGPDLDHLKESGSVLYPDKTDDDMFAFVSIKCKSDAQEAIDSIKGLIESFGLPLEMIENFGELKFHAGDGEILIGFKAAANEHTAMAKQFLLSPTVFGDGSENVSLDLSVNLATTFDQLLDDEPMFTHLLKGASVHGTSHIHEKTRENIIQILAEKKDQLDPLISVFPFAAVLLLFKKADGMLELQCTDEMKETIKTFAQNNMPPA